LSLGLQVKQVEHIQLLRCLNLLAVSQFLGVYRIFKDYEPWVTNLTSL
jgi:hypothetical protein